MGGKGQFTLSNDGNAITGNGTADGATFTWNGTRAKPPAITASQPILQPAFVSVYLGWDGTPDHPNAEVWVSVNGQAEIPAATLYGDVFKQPKIAAFELRLQRGSGVYKYVLKDRGNTLASVVVPVP